MSRLREFTALHNQLQFVKTSCDPDCRSLSREPARPRHQGARRRRRNWLPHPRRLPPFGKGFAQQIEWLDLGMPTVGERSTLAKRVMEYIKAQEILLAKITPRQVLSKTMSEATNEKALGEIFDASLKHPICQCWNPRLCCTTLSSLECVTVFSGCGALGGCTSANRCRSALWTQPRFSS